MHAAENRSPRLQTGLKTQSPESLHQLRPEKQQPRRSVGPNRLQLVEAGHRLLVWNKPGPELGTPITQGRTVQEVVETVAGPLGPVPTEGGRGYVLGVSWDKPSLGIMTPFDEKPATVGNGVMVAFSVGKTEDVDRIYKKALELGATDECPAGPRGDGFYAGYFRDLDGNKLNVFCMSRGPAAHGIRLLSHLAAV